MSNFCAARAHADALAVGPVGQVGRLFYLSHRLYAIKSCSAPIVPIVLPVLPRLVLLSVSRICALVLHSASARRRQRHFIFHLSPRASSLNGSKRRERSFSPPAFVTCSAPPCPPLYSVIFRFLRLGMSVLLAAACIRDSAISSFITHHSSFFPLLPRDGGCELSPPPLRDR